MARRSARKDLRTRAGLAAVSNVRAPRDRRVTHLLRGAKRARHPERTGHRGSMTQVNLGGPTGIRTQDQPVMSRPLSPLSYGPHGESIAQHKRGGPGKQEAGMLPASYSFQFLGLDCYRRPLPPPRSRLRSFQPPRPPAGPPRPPSKLPKPLSKPPPPPPLLLRPPPPPPKPLSR